MNNAPLVSCTVLTYNSSVTVLETLESIKAQSYQNIELIISDDCSTDNSVELCRDWLAHNGERFVRTVMLTTEKNGGVASNANRALAECQGEWRKGIAADDILFPNCVEDFVDFVERNPDAKWVSSYVREYHGSFTEKNCLGKNLTQSRNFFKANVEEQLRIMARRNFIYAPSLFYNIAVLRELGGFDVSYKIEDYPLYMRLLEHGYKCYFVEKETVGYRIHESLAHSDKILFNYRNQVELRKMAKDLSFKYLTKKEKLGLKLLWNTQDIIERNGMNNKSNKLSKLVYKTSRYLTYHIFISSVKR